MQTRIPDSELTKYAAKYAIEKGRKSRMLLSHCRRFEVLMGRIPLAMITDDDIAEYRKRAERAGFSPITTDHLLIDVRTIVNAATGVILKPGRECARSKKPTKLMIAATKYCEDGGLRSKALIHNCRRFFNDMGDQFGDIEPGDITSDHLVEFRKAGLKRGLSRVTVEKTITDIMTACRSVTGVLLNAGRRLRRNRPTPDPAPLDSIERVFHVSPEWFQQWLIITTWTGMRIMDSMRLQLMIQTAGIHGGEFISFQASKTGKHHIWPIADWLRPWLIPVELPYRKATHWGVRRQRARLTEQCLKAGVPRITPKQLRQRCITQWTRANGAAGAIIHGKSLGVLDSYIDQPELLLEAMPKVIMPAAFKLRAGICDPPASESDGPFKMFQQMDEKTRAVLMQTMRALLGTKEASNG